MAEVVTAAITVRAAIRDATRLLSSAGCDSPRLDAELLLASILGVDRARLVLDATEELDGCAARRFEELVARRAAREPVAYILGQRDFRRITLAVDPRVLIPRPETELLVEVGSALPAGAHVLDVGTGSGAVALALKEERPGLGLIGSDCSAGAVALARENAARLGLEVAFVEADLTKGLPGPFDAVLANLPYVADAAALPPEIAYEPSSALFAGADGLDVIRRLVAELDEVPFVALEVGAGQAPAVATLLGDAGFVSVQALPDLAGHERVVVGHR